MVSGRQEEERCQFSRIYQSLFCLSGPSEVLCGGNSDHCDHCCQPTWGAAATENFLFCTWPAFLTKLTSLGPLMNIVHFPIYVNVKSICCIPETNIICQLYFSEKALLKKGKNGHCAYRQLNHGPDRGWALLYATVSNTGGPPQQAPGQPYVERALRGGVQYLGCRH